MFKDLLLKSISSHLRLQISEILSPVLKSNAINFYDGASYDHLGWDYSIFDQTTVLCRGFETGDLQGVDYTRVKYLKFKG